MSKPARRIAILGLLLSLLAGPSPGLVAKDTPKRPPLAPGIQRERVSLVLVDVVVTDSSGRAVRDLRPEEFTLMVDGHAVAIQSVDLQLAGEPESGTAPPEIPSEPAGPAPPAALPGAPPRDTARPVFRPRGIVLFFDGLNSDRGLGPAPIESARRFLKEGLQEGDEVMVIGLGRQCRIYLNFTPDLSRAVEALEEVEKDPGLRMGGESHYLKNLEEIEELRKNQIYGAADALATMYASEDLRRASRLTLALEALSEALRTRPGRKEVFLFSDGFPSNPGVFYDASGIQGAETNLLRVAQESSTSQMALNLINTQGLVAGRVGGATDLLERLSTDSLATLSLNSGGVLTHGVNRGFERPMRKIEAETRASYLLSFAPEGEPDGKLHPVRVLVRRKGVRVRAPEGYVWMTEDQRRESETRSAYFAPELFRKIPLALEADTYLGSGGKPGVELAVGVPCDSILFLPRGGHRSARLEAGVVLRSADGKAEEPVSGKAEVRLPGGAGEEPGDLTLLLRRTVPAGDYLATAVVRDLESGDVGALQAPVKIPALDSAHLAMSSLILSRRGGLSHRVDLSPSVKGGWEAPASPSVWRVFGPGEQVTASALVYHPRRDPATGNGSVTAFAQIHRGGEVVRHLAPARHRVEAGKGPATLTLKIPVDLAGLEPGVYELEVEAWDEVERRGIVQRVEFLIR